MALYIYQCGYFRQVVNTGSHIRKLLCFELVYKTSILLKHTLFNKEIICSIQNVKKFTTKHMNQKYKSDLVNVAIIMPTIFVLIISIIRYISTQYLIK